VRTSIVKRLLDNNYILFAAATQAFFLNFYAGYSEIDKSENAIPCPDDGDIREEFPKSVLSGVRIISWFTSLQE